MLQSKGLDPEESIAFLKTLSTKHRYLPELYRKVLDVHPLPENAISAVEKALIHLDIKQGRKTRQPTPLSPKIKETTDTVLHETYVERYLRERHYDRSSSLERIQLLSGLIEHLGPENNSRINDFEKVASKLASELSIPSDKKAYQEMLDQILDLPNRVPETDAVAITRAFEVRNHLLLYTGGLMSDPAGAFAETHRLITSFMQAQSYDEAKSAAEALMRDLHAKKLLPFHVNGSLVGSNFNRSHKDEYHRNKFLPQFEMPFSYGEPKVVSWNRFVEWAGQDDSRLINDVMLKWFYIRDWRLMWNLSIEDLLELERYSGPNPWTDPSYKFVIDQDGTATQRETSPQRNMVHILFEKIHKLGEQADSGDEAAKAKLLKLSGKLWTRNDSGEELLPYERIHSWGEKLNDYRENPPRFSKLIATSLVGDHFAEWYDLNDIGHQKRWVSGDLVGEFKKLLQKDRAKYSDLVRGFFTGRPDGRDIFQLETSGFGGTVDASVRKELVSFVMADPFHLFSAEEKLAIRGWNRMTRKPTELEAIRKLIGYQKPTSVAELIAVLKRLTESDRPRTLNDKAESSLIQAYRDMANAEANQFLAENKPEHLPVFEIARRTDQQVLRPLTPYIRDSRNWPNAVEDLIRFYKIINSSLVFLDNADTEKHLLEKIIGDIKALPNAATRIELIEAMFQVGKIPYPSAKNELQILWTESIYQFLGGKDDGTLSYKLRVQAIVDRLKTTLAYNRRYELFAMLGKRLETQHGSTQLLRDNLFEWTAKNLQETQLYGQIAEAASQMLKEFPGGRMEMIDFLTKPLTRQSLAHVSTLLEEQAKRWDKDKTLTKEHYEIKARQLYDNYWSLPLEARAIVLEELLLPVGQRNTDEEYKAAFDKVADRLFNTGDAYDIKARRFLEVYLKKSRPYQRSLLLAAMMAAEVEAEGQGSRAFRIGQRLGMVFEMMGPAEILLGQVIHSHDKTPEEMREGMAKLKTKADVPTRWTLWDLYVATVPENVREDAHLENIEGAGKLHIAFNVRFKDGRRGTFRIRRPFAIDRMDRGFDVMLQVAEELAPDEPLMNDLIPMILEAAQRGRAEADDAIASEQFRKAKDLYEGLEVKIGKYNFKFNFVDLYGSGEGWTLMEPARGLPFDEIDDVEYKRALAKATLVTELYLILRGKHIDMDRHSGQLRADGENVNLLDPGGLILKLPSPMERRMLGQILFEVLAEHRWGKDLSEAFVERIREQNNKQVSAYLQNIQKALLSLGDMSRILRPEDLREVIGTVLQSGEIHRDIVVGVIQKAASHPIEAARLIKGSVSSPCAELFLRINRR